MKGKSGTQMVAVVTGGSSGIGKFTAQALAEKGCRVYEFSRRESQTPGVCHIFCDVAEEEQVRAAVGQVIREAGRIDILVNNAGFGISGAAEFTDNAAARRLLDVNLFGAVNGCRAVIPVMREQGGGRIVNISSLAAPVAIPFQAWYSVSKAAVSTYTAALSDEVAPFGITCCTVLPGDIRTGFTAAREKSPAGDEIYGGRIHRSVAVMERDEKNGLEPEAVGRYVAALALRRGGKPEYAVGASGKALAVLAKLLPNRLKRTVVRRLYGGGQGR